MRRPLLAALAASCAVSALVALGACPRPVAASRPPNVLIVLWDTARADRLSLYGYPVPTTPRLDALAAEAAVYERATSRGIWTLPAHSSMFTGLTETQHGAEAHVFWLDNQHQTLAERLGAVGYDTFAFSANPVVGLDSNLLQGFGTVETTFPRAGARRGRYVRDSKAATRRKLLPADASQEIGPSFLGNPVDGWSRAVFKDAAPVAHRALFDFLRERPEPTRPWFAYLNLMEAHSPRIPSMRSRRAVADEATIALGLATDTSLFAKGEYVVNKREYTPEELRAIGAVYDASLRDLDDATGDLVDDLRANKLLDDTVVIVVADHGEMLGEHRAMEHRWAVWEPLLHVPLVIRYPARFPAGRIRERVSTGDLFATILDLARQPIPEGVASTSLVGRSRWDDVVVSQVLDPFSFQLGNLHEMYPDVDVVPFTRTWCVAYDQLWKLVYASDGGHALHDLGSDPTEDVNLYAQATEQRTRLEDGLLAFERGLTPHDPTRRDAEDLRHIERNAAQVAKRADEGGEEEAAQLAALGYTSSDIGVQQTYPTFCGPWARQAAGGTDGGPGTP
jgi:arylsulfatase A-like enzyme